MAQEQVNVELKLVADAETAIKDIEQNLKYLRDKAVKIPIEFDVQTTGDGGKGAKKITDQYTAQIKSLRQQTDVIARQEKSLRAQLSTYKQLANAQQRLAQGRAGTGAKLQQIALGNFDKARRDIKNTETQITIVKNALKGASLETEVWQRALKNVRDEARKTNSIFGQLTKTGSGGFFSTLLGKLTLGGIAVEAFKQGVAGLGNVLQQGIDFQQLEISLEAFSGSAAKASELYQDFKETSIKTPFSIGDVAQAGKTLLAFGLDVDDVSESTDKLSIIAGATGSNLNNLARNLGQISAQGRAFTRDLNQFATAGIPIFTELAKVLGVTVEEVRKLTETGDIDFEAVQSAFDNLTTAGSAFAQVASRQVETVQGQIGNLQTAIQELSAELVKAASPNVVKLFRALSGAIGFLAQNSTELISVLTGLGLSITALKGFQLFSNSDIINNFKGIAQVKELTAELAILEARKQALELSGAFSPEGIEEANRQITETSVRLEEAKGKAESLKATLKGLAISTAITVGITLLTLAFNKLREAATKSFGAITSQSQALKALNKELKNQLTGAGVVDDEDLARIQKVTKATDFYNGSLGKLITTAANLVPVVGSLASGFLSFNRILKNTELKKLLKDIDNLGQKSLAAADRLATLSENALAFGDPKEIRKQLGQQADFIAATTSNVIVLTKQLAELNEQQAQSFSPATQQVIDQTTQSLAQQKAALAAVIPEYRKLKEAVTPATLFAKALGGDLKSAAAFAGQAADQFKLLQGRVDALAEARLAPLNTGAAQLKAQLSAITYEYDLQNAALKQQKATQDAILQSLSAEEALAEAKAIGPEEYKRELQQQQQQAKEELRLLEIAQSRGALVQEDINKQKRLLAVLGVRIKNADTEVNARQRVAEADFKIAQNAENAAVASEDTRVALADVETLSAAIANDFDAVKTKLDEVIAKADAANIGDQLPENVGEAVGQAQELGNKLDELDRKQYTVDVEFTVDETALGRLRAAGINIDLSNFRAAGGPVEGGSKYTVNELGKEAFLGASGRLSMINAKSWGAWRAPEDGVVIPAHLTKKLNVPSGGVNLNNPRSAAVGRRTASVERGVGGQAAQMLRVMHSTQQSQAQQLGKLSRAIDAMRDKDWKVDVNINGNNPLLDRLRRR